MKPKATKGPCSLCGKEYTRAGMGKHLASCLMNKIDATSDEDTSCFHLLVTTRFPSGYWLHLQTDARATLKTLDGFLRKVWLECCGHMSCYFVGKQTIGMSRRLESILKPGVEIDYDYDMGDTTPLRIRVLGKYPGLTTKRKPIEILARNLSPKIPCDECEKQSAVVICPDCNDEGEGWLCTTCAKQHDCAEENDYHPVANSPRAGVCGYTGE